MVLSPCYCVHTGKQEGQRSTTMHKAKWLVPGQGSCSLLNSHSGEKAGFREPQQSQGGSSVQLTSHEILMFVP